VNVNVTLLFSVRRYEQVMDAYLRGLAARAAQGDPVDAVASVASFFVSRIDAKVDPLLPAGSPLRGRVAIANARVAYQSQLEHLASPQWRRISKLGARPQRLLWASTGTKDPGYSDVRYVSELIGPDTVNTMPEKTLRAFGDHGEVSPTLAADPDSARRTLADAARAGIDLEAITADLERAGVSSFCESYHELLDCITSKLAAPLTGAP
jgi:transaldolase